MIRTILIALLTAVLLTTVSLVEAQQPKKVPRIGYISAVDPSRESTRSEAIRLALRELGYMEGQNIAIEYRYGEGKQDRWPALAAELVRADSRGARGSGAERESEAALLVLIGAPRLRRLGLDVPQSVLSMPEHRLYNRLASSHPESAHSRYNALSGALCASSEPSNASLTRPGPNPPLYERPRERRKK